MTQVPSLDETPSPPAMVGTETLAMVVSSRTTKFASESRMQPPQSAAPTRGLGGWAASFALASRAAWAALSPRATTGAMPSPEPWAARGRSAMA